MPRIVSHAPGPNRPPQIPQPDYYRPVEHRPPQAPKSSSGNKKFGAFVAAGLAVIGGAATFPEWQDSIPNSIPFVGNDATEAAEPVDGGLLPGMSRSDDGSIFSSGMHFNSGESPELIEQMESCGNNTDKILLTFDDKGSDEHIRAIMNTLTANNIGAVFFPNSDYVSGAMISEMRNNGFWVGEHSDDHANMHHMQTLGEMQQAVQGGTGSNLFRPPYGATYSVGEAAYFDNRAYQAASAVGSRICLWEIDTNDWREGRTAQEVTDSVLNNLEPGAVVLMHMVDGYPSYDALPAIIQGVRAAGREFCAHPGAPTQVQIPEQLPC